MATLTRDVVLSSAQPDPELLIILEKIGPIKPVAGPVEKYRADAFKRRELMRALFDYTTDCPTISEISIPSREGGVIPARLYVPQKTPAAGSPLVVVFHGGGYCTGGLYNEDLNCINFARNHGCISVNVDYRLAPEHPFPAASNDAWDALKWAAANATKLGATPSQGFIVAGASAGGTLTDVVAHLARDEKLEPPLTGLIEMIPAVLHNTVVPEKYKPDYLSFEQNKDALILGQQVIEYFMGHLKPDPHNWHFAPFNHPDGHKGLPPIYFQVCGMDPLRDDAIIYERVLRTEVGIKTKIDLYPGVPHGFYSTFPKMTATKQFIADTNKGLGWLLEVGKQ